MCLCLAEKLLSQPVVVKVTLLTALMKGIEWQNTEPGLKECIHIFLGFCYVFTGFSKKMLTLNDGGL